VAEQPVRVPIDSLRTDQRDRLRVLAAGAALELRWDGDTAIVVAPGDEAQARLLVAAASGVAMAPRPSSPAPERPIEPLGTAGDDTPAERPAAAPAETAAAERAMWAMWAIDPTGRHEYRYWSGTTWTAHVADRGVQGADPLVEMPPERPIEPPPGAHPAAAAASGMVASPWTASAPADPTRVLGRRYGAFFIDVVITLAVFVLAFLPFATTRSVPETLRLPGCHRSSFDSAQVQCDDRVVLQLGDTVYDADLLPTALITLAFVVVYFAVLQGVTGATLGKRAAGIRVVRPDGSTVGVGRSFVRWLLFVVDGPLTFYLCGIITTAATRGHRRLGDMAAQTYVVSRHAAGRPIEIP
jgi:uncharacterized RDD family membrane protein YckC